MDPAEIDERVAADATALCYSLMPFGICATLLNSSLTALLHWGLVPSWLLISWLAAFAILSSVRLVVRALFLRAPKSGSLRGWRRLFVAGISASGVIWGIAGFFALFHHSPVHHLLVAFAVGGMMAGAAATYSSLLTAFFGYSIPAMLPQIVILCCERDPVHMAMAAMLALFLILLSVPAARNYTLLRSTFRFRYEREALVDSLTDERDRVQKMNVGLTAEVGRRQDLELGLRAAHAELERKVAERTTELASANERLQAANSELAAFSHTVSHDLRAPLHAIGGFAQLVEQRQRDRLDSTSRHCLTRLHGTVSRMSELIDDLLSFASVSEGEVESADVDLSSLAREVAVTLSARDPQRQVEWVIQPGCTARGDPRLLRVALENLLENAWKFTGKAAAPRIELGMRDENGRRVFFVADNGVGFDMAHASELFRPFRRLHPSSEFPGTGIGLATVERIVRRHHGTVRAESEPGRGATFWLYL